MESKKVLLNNNQKEMCLNNISILNSNILSLYQSIHNNKIDENSRNLSAQVIEYKLYELFKILGYNGNLVTGIEKRFEEIRDANSRIKELEEELKSFNYEFSLQEQIVSIMKILTKWWNIDGFRQVNDIKFNADGSLEVLFGFNISDINNIYTTDKPEDIFNNDNYICENWVQQLEKRDFKLFTNELKTQIIFDKKSLDEYKKNMFNNYGTILVDCLENRNLLKTLIKNNIPSAKITTWNTDLFLEKDDEEIFSIQGIKVIVKDILDIKKLEPYVSKFIKVEI